MAEIKFFDNFSENIPVVFYFDHCYLTAGRQLAAVSSLCELCCHCNSFFDSHIFVIAFLIAFFKVFQAVAVKLFFIAELIRKLRFFLAKGPDVPTYVEYGAADIGIVGKDTILEEGRRLYEVLDLGYGKCRMCVCGPESARELLQHNQQIRVATKYPNIAKDYFYNRKHQTVEMIKLNGSIELAPIVGLSEVIVDIVETGSTLRENGLTVLEEVCPLSARMVVNQVSMRMENERITKLIQDLKGALV